MQIQNLFPGATIETEDEQVIKIADMQMLDEHPNFSGEVVVVTDPQGNKHFFGAYEEVFVL